MSDQLDNIMEKASESLFKNDYLSCERLCREALEEAKTRAAWPVYARIVLPLQECRRQRRLLAADGVIRLGSEGETDESLREKSLCIEAGCIVITHPHGHEVAKWIYQAARSSGSYIEILYADNAADADAWRIRPAAGSHHVECVLPRPSMAWLNRWFEPGECRRAADWFITATEALGNEAIGQITGNPSLSDIERLHGYEQMLDVVTDHELLHQYLAQSAEHLIPRGH